MNYKALNSGELKYSRIVGTGGIGSGMFFELIGNETLGRNETRLGILRPYRDYSKLHIILHYISVLLGVDKLSDFHIYPIGKVGEDDTGKGLLAEMKAVGMDLNNIKMANSNTLFSVCFQYPDSTGGNITTINCASNEVTAEDIAMSFQGLKALKKEILLAVPEVPVLARIKLLEIGRARGSFNIASFLPAEIKQVKDKGGFKLTDLLAINIDEARAIAGINKPVSKQEIIKGCIENLLKYNEEILVVITDGPNGSYGYFSGKFTFVPPLTTTPISTAGAGDAFLAGIITGLCCGLPFLKDKNDSVFSESPLTSSLELGTLLASLSVTSPDTIHKGIDAESLYHYVKEKSLKLSDSFLNLFLDDCIEQN